MVYFVMAVDDPGKFVKIGFTESSIESRLAVMQTGCPYRLAVVLTINGDRDLESSLHRRFRKSRHRGEWFRISDDILEFVLEVAGGDIREAARTAFADDNAVSRLASAAGVDWETMRGQLQDLYNA